MGRMVTDWEAVLAAEGLGPLGWSRLASSRQVYLCTEPFTGAVGPDWDEQERMRRAIAWLPEADRFVLRSVLAGVEQAEIGRSLGITQPAIHGRIAEAVRRAQLLDAGRLPEDRDEYRRLLRGFWQGRQHKYRLDVIMAFFVDLLDTWSPRVVGRWHGVKKMRAHVWPLQVIEADAPRLAPVQHLLRVMKAAPSKAIEVVDD